MDSDRIALSPSRDLAIGLSCMPWIFFAVLSFYRRHRIREMHSGTHGHQSKKPEELPR
jgi:hypothetical protein